MRRNDLALCIQDRQWLAQPWWTLSAVIQSVCAGNKYCHTVPGFAVSEVRLVLSITTGEGDGVVPAPIDPEDHDDEIERHQGTPKAKHRYVGETEK